MSDDENEGDVTYKVVFDDEPDKAYPYLPPKDGKATATFPNGDTYVGEYKDGQKHGRGVYTFGSGAKYDGEYAKNLKDGFGTFYAPDKGKYTGQWSNDKRDGKGTYVFPNGDSYTGVWKKGAKHGAGTYTYAKIDSSIDGSWSNGQCVDGNWNIHDSSQYIGAFLANQPAGDGLFKFANGNCVSGKYTNLQFKSTTFVKPHPTAPLPEPRKPDPYRKACRAVDKAVCKSDHYNEMHQLKAVFAGVPNYRKVKGTNVCGCGQPSLEGFRQMQESLAEGGMDKITWVNVRDDPVVYVNGLPFSPRDRRELDEPMRLGMSAPQLAELEARMQDNLKFSVKKKGGLHDYHEDVVNPETLKKVTADKTIQVTNVEGVDDIKSVSAMHEFLVEDEHGVEYKRVPISNDKAPTVDEFDALAKQIREMDGGGVVFSDTLGGTKASTAMCVALLMLGTGGGEEEEEGGDEEGGEGDEAPKEKEEEVYDEMAPNLNRGQYDVVMDMVKALNGPDPEEERKKRLEEEAKRKEEEEEKKKAEEEAQKAAEGEEGGDEEAAAEEAEKADEGDEGDEGYAEKKEETEEAAEGEAEAAEDLTPLEWIKTGNIVKAQVDEAIDACNQMGNIRGAILEVRASFDVAAPDQQNLYKRKAANYLERYYYMILFAAYLKDLKDGKLDPEPAPEGAYGEDEEDAGPKVQSFAKWCDNHAALVEKLGTRTKGVLAEFSWN